jgi:hypothetical protein
MTEKKLPHPTTSKQAEANRRNAAKSTGPRTDAGKDASSGNATRHGAYATRIQPISRGPFAEDADELSIFVDAYVAARRPRDDLERICAVTMANLEWRSRRVDRLETEEFHRVSRRTVFGGGVFVDELELAVDAVELAEAFYDFVIGGWADPVDADPEELVDWLGRMLHPMDEEYEEGRWECETPPDSTEDWWAFLGEIVGSEFRAPLFAEAWAEQQLAQAQRELQRHQEVAAEHATRGLLETLPRVVGLQSRLQRDLERQEGRYRQLQARDLPGEDRSAEQETEPDEGQIGG